jgi:hypothetical protein
MGHAFRVIAVVGGLASGTVAIRNFQDVCKLSEALKELDVHWNRCNRTSDKVQKL